MKADFKKDLAEGLKFEQEFLELFPARLIKNTTNLKYDFITPTQESLELKSDRYKTNNFFFERYSNLKTKTPGSVWQSSSHHVEYFCYWFVNQKKYYLFKVSELEIFLNKYVEDNKLKLIEIPNTTHTSAGYLIKQSVLKDSGLCLEIESEFLVKKSELVNAGVETGPRPKIKKFKK